MSYPECQNCKYCNYQYILFRAAEYDRCIHPKRYCKYCDIERNYDVITSCKSRGLLFEPMTKFEKIKKHLISGIFYNIPLLVLILSMTMIFFVLLL